MEMLTDHKCNVTTGHDIDEVEHNVPEDMVDYNLVCRQTLSEHDTIDEIKAACNVVKEGKAKLKDNDTECRSATTEEFVIVDIKAENDDVVNDTKDYDRSTTTDDYEADDIKVKIIQEIITPENFTNIEIMWKSILTTDVASNSIKTEDHEEINQNIASESATIADVKHEDMFFGEVYSSDDNLPIAETIKNPELSTRAGKQAKGLPDNTMLKIKIREKPFSCEVCYKTFAKTKYLISHMKIHSGKKLFTCKVCLKPFTQKSSLTTHMRIHSGEKPFSCEVCYKAFTKTKYLKRHMRRHSGETPFSCEVCRKIFFEKDQLPRHMKIHSGEKPFLCEVCHKTFTQKSTLTRHMRTHSGEKPFTCQVCHNTYSQKSHLISHMRTHSGAEPFSCQVCHKKYTQKSPLKRHMMTHSGEKPFSCEVCHKIFYVNYRLIRHMRTHSGEKHTLEKKVSLPIC